VSAQVRPDLFEGQDAAGQPPAYAARLEGVDPSALAAFHAFHSACSTFGKLFLRDVTRGGTQPSHMEALRVLGVADGLCQRDIAAAMGISRTRVTSIVQELEQMGAVYRSRDEADKRFARVFLTEVGRSVEQAKGRLGAAHINGVFAGMSEQDRLDLKRRLEDLDRRFKSVLQREDRD